MTDTVSIRRLRGGSLFKLLFIGHLFFSVPVFACLGILGSFDLVDISWNMMQVHGIAAILTSLLAGLFLSLFFSIFFWVILFLGLWFYSRFTSMQLEYFPVE